MTPAQKRVLDTLGKGCILYNDYITPEGPTDFRYEGTGKSVRRDVVLRMIEKGYLKTELDGSFCWIAYRHPELGSEGK